MHTLNSYIHALDYITYTMAEGERFLAVSVCVELLSIHETTAVQNLYFVTTLHRTTFANSTAINIFLLQVKSLSAGFSVV
ncbi:hypothetical protein PsorP6_009330 [Peronosclerospora sorghi]|uniref:Uncharacterized protein n=1 Tax=Peronosclerospora sorghi TaxID=230839 RepID=A0ACC0W0S4_9STRA|nr:hypothetical protein PsorP6_009330 [Peronosclerospora sorghi]